MAVNKRDLNTLAGETGWPVVNYAQDWRNLQSAPGNIASALSIPRFKFTWMVEFHFSPRALDNPVTNLNEFVDDFGKLYVHLISIDHPQATIKTEKLRSYNKWINVPTQVEYPAASMTFHDDSTSIVQALWKENLNFYTHQATIGNSFSGLENKASLAHTNDRRAYQFTEDLTATDGGEMRSSMGTRPSLGMRLKPNDGRHFLESIAIADLGTEPDGINLYWFHNPMLTGWAPDNLDKEDRTGNSRVTTSFDYEGYYFTIGQNRGRMDTDELNDGQGGFARKAGIARDGLERAINRPIENGFVPISADTITTPERATAEEAAASENILNNVSEPALESELNPAIPNSLAGKQQDLDQTRAERAAIQADPARAADNRDRLSRLDAREAELIESIKTQKAEERAANFINEPERSALSNTEEASGISGASPSSTGPNPERAAIIDAGALAADGVKFERQASGLNRLATQQAEQAESDRNLAKKADDAGDAPLARQLQLSADANEEASKNNAILADIATVNADSKFAAADNASDLNKKNASLNDEP